MFKKWGNKISVRPHASERKKQERHTKGASTLVGDPNTTANNSNTGKQMSVRKQANRGEHTEEKAERHSSQDDCGKLRP